MSSATSLKEWRDELKRLERKVADQHLLSPSMRRALHGDVDRALSRIRFFEAEVELESVQAEINAQRTRDAA